MSPFIPSDLVLTLVAAVVVVTALTAWRGRRRTTLGLRLPPGPAPLPFFGNFFQIDAKKPWVTYTELSTRYGDIFMIRVLKQDIIVINSEKIAKELFERRSNIYSDRPHFTTRDPWGWFFHFAWAQYGDRWRSQRRMLHQHFRPEAALTYHPIHLKKTHDLILDILNTPQDYLAHIQRFSAAVIMSIVYDYEVAPGRDHLVELFERGSALAFEALTPEISCIIDAFPSGNLPEWFPGGVFKRKARVSKNCAMQMVEEPFEHAMKREAEGSTAAAMALGLLRRHKCAEDPVRLQLLKDTCATAFIAGAETSATTLKCFILAMVENSKVQERAQAEINAVVGANRLPSFEDRPNLPYTEAILLELLRFYTIVPLGVPHANTADDIYEDIFIPKGSTIVPNAWAMLHNEDIYPEHDIFKPERFIKDGKFSGGKFGDSPAFGFGRRICPGRYASDSAIWISMVAILSVFKMTKALSEEGEELDFVPTFTTGVVTSPNPFPCTIKPRMSDADIHKLLTKDV